MQPTLMQYLLTCVACLIALKIVLRVRARAMGVLFALFWIVGTIGVLVFVWNQPLASRLSAMLGVGRGVDAALYLGVALLFYIVLRIFVRLEHLEHMITRLVSENAILKEEIRKK